MSEQSDEPQAEVVEDEDGEPVLEFSHPDGEPVEKMLEAMMADGEE